MAKLLYSSDLKKKLTGDQLRGKVGRIQVKSGAGSQSLAGTELKKFILTKLGGKTASQMEKDLRIKYGVAGSQVRKRQALMKLIAGDEETGLTEEQVKRNLKLNMQKDESGLIRQDNKMSFAGGGVVSRTMGGARTKGTMGDIGVKRGETGFAKNFNNTKLPDSPAPKPPAGGTRPIGL